LVCERERERETMMMMMMMKQFSKHQVSKHRKNMSHVFLSSSTTTCHFFIPEDTVCFCILSNSNRDCELSSERMRQRGTERVVEHEKRQQVLCFRFSPLPLTLTYGLHQTASLSLSLPHMP
jgi:hypothetical protein